MNKKINKDLDENLEEDFETVTNFNQIPNNYWVLIRNNELIIIHESFAALENYVETLLASQKISPSEIQEFSLCKKHSLKFGVSILQ